MFQPGGLKPYPENNRVAFKILNFRLHIYTCDWMGDMVGGGGGGECGGGGYISTQLIQLKYQTSFGLEILSGSDCFYAHQWNSRQLQRIQAAFS